MKNKQIKEINYVSESDVLKEMKDNKFSDENKLKFVESIFKNYFLDNDNINFLEENGYNFFDITDDEMCFCLSDGKYVECCKKKMSKKREQPYTSYEESLTSASYYDKFSLYIDMLFKKNYSLLSEKENCNIKNCDLKTVESCLYDIIDFEDQYFYSTNSLNPLNSFLKMGDIFFNIVTKNNFKFYGFCKKHNEEIKNLELENNDIDDEKILLIHYKTLIYKTFIYRVSLKTTIEDYLTNFNSIENKGYKSIFIYRLKKLANQTRSILDVLNIYKNNIIENKEIKIFKWTLPVQRNFLVSDLMYPQVCPNDFKMVNSINNIFIKENPMLINISQKADKTIISISFDKNNQILLKFIHQYLLLINEKIKNFEIFFSNCSLILTDNILFSKEYFEKLSKDEQALLSALNKFRLENPNAGQEYIKMQFFAGFIRGNNFFINK